MSAETVRWWRHIRRCFSNESRQQTLSFCLPTLLQFMHFSFIVLKVFWHTLLLPLGDVFAPYPLPLPVLYRCGIVSCRFVCTKTEDPAALALLCPCLSGSGHMLNTMQCTSNVPLDDRHSHQCLGFLMSSSHLCGGSLSVKLNGPAQYESTNQCVV